MRKIASLVVVVLLSAASAGNANAGGWKGYSYVKQYVFEGEDSGERMYVSMTINPSALEDNCSSGGSGWKRIYGHTEKGKRIIASILSAYTAKQRIQLKLSGCDDWGRNVVTGVMVSD